ncbi:MAG TPA: hypothetical protein VIT91_18950 [Chthoniobacterales bacterium]
MRMFTFSGIKGQFHGVNVGEEIVNLAWAVIAGLPATAYQGKAGTDHFASNVNLGKLADNPWDLVTLDGSRDLNAEADEFAPVFGAQIGSVEDSQILILAHSQGCNNCVTALNWLFEHQAAWYRRRALRVVLFDPKVGTDRVITLFNRDPERKFLAILFFQSEKDVLQNQKLVSGGKFIDQFRLGNQIWIKKLDHGSIVEWPSVDASQQMLTREGYYEFAREYQKARARIPMSPRNPNREEDRRAKLEKFVRDYSNGVITARPSLAIHGFLKGRLAARFVS